MSEPVLIGYIRKARLALVDPVGGGGFVGIVYDHAPDDNGEYVPVYVKEPTEGSTFMAMLSEFDGDVQAWVVGIDELPERLFGFDNLGDEEGNGMVLVEAVENGPVLVITQADFDALYQWA